jgi:hypothetical protein
VKLKVEKDRESALEQEFNDGGAAGDKQLQAHLEPLAGSFQAIDSRRGGLRIGHVEGND